MSDTVRVVVRGEIEATVDLPRSKQREGVVCDDPAIEAAVTALPQSIKLYLWGDDGQPAEVTLDAGEESFTVEEDDRTEDE